MRTPSRSWSARCAPPRNGAMSSARWISGWSGKGWMRGDAPPPGTGELLFQKLPRGDLRQAGDRPVVDIGPRLAGCAVFVRHLQHPPDILRRFRKAFAAGLIHVELAEQRVAVAQAVQFAEHDVGGILREHQPRIMLDEIEPAAAGGGPEKI